MAFIEITEKIDNLYVTTWQKRKKEVIDNVFNATPLWAWMKAHGGLKGDGGGRYIEVPLEYAKNETFVWFQKGGTVPIHDTEFLTLAQYPWKYCAVSIVRFGVDEQQNKGKAAHLKLVERKLSNAEKTLIEKWEETLFHSDDTNAPDGISDLITTDGTGTVGGINASTYTWWKNKYYDMNGEDVSTYLVARMRKMYNDVMQNQAQHRPDVLVTTQAVFEAYEAELLDFYRFENKQLADLGFENLMFRRTPLIYSSYCPTGKMFFLNTKYVYLVYDPDYWFDMTEWKPIPEQPNDRVAQIVCAANLVVSRRASLGVIFNISA